MGDPAQKDDGENPADVRGSVPPKIPQKLPPRPTAAAPKAADGVLLTAYQKRMAEREARRQAKDAAYDLRQERKKIKDGTSLRGHHIVDTKTLDEAFPEPESPELPASTVRRRIFHGVILVLLLAVVVAGVVLAGMVQRGELEVKVGPWKAIPTPFACPAETLNYLPNDSVSVNVFNGGSAEGKAGQVAEELKARGFVIKAVDNQFTEYSAPAIVVSGVNGRSAAYTMQQNFPGTDYVQDDREDATVDVILTSSYTGLVAEPKVVKEPGVLSCPRLSPAPSEPAVTVPPAP